MLNWSGYWVLGIELIMWNNAVNAIYVYLCYLIYRFIVTLNLQKTFAKK